MPGIHNGIGTTFRNQAFGGGGGAVTFPYIADKYANCTTICSLFKGSASYSGDCMEIQRQSDGVYFYIPFDGDVIDYDALVSQASDGQTYNITTWYDSSGNGNNWINPTAAKQPQIIESGIVQITDSLFIWNGPFDERRWLHSSSLDGLTRLDFYESLKLTGTYQDRYSPLLGRKTGSMETFLVDPGGTSTLTGFNDGSPTLYVDGVDVTSDTTGDRYTALSGSEATASALNVNTSRWTFYGALGGSESTNVKMWEARFRGAWFFSGDTSSDQSDIEADIAYLRTLTIS